MNKKRVLVALILGLLLLTTGCNKIYTSRANPEKWITQEEFENLPEPNQAMFQKKFVLNERTVKYITTAGEVIERTAPVAIGLADLIWPGAGLSTLFAAVLAGVLNMRKKHGKAITQAGTILDHTQNGVLILFDAIEEYKKAFPDDWEEKLKPLVVKNRDEAEGEAIMPEDVARFRHVLPLEYI